MSKVLRLGMAMIMVLLVATGGTLTAFAANPTLGYSSNGYTDEYAEDAIEYEIEDEAVELEYYAPADDSAYDNPAESDPIEEVPLYVPAAEIPAITPILIEALSLDQVSSFAELQAAVNSAVNGVEKRIEIVADFPFEATISIQRDRIITLYTNGSIHHLTAPTDARHFNVQGALNLQDGVSLVGNGGNGGGVSNNGTFNMSGNSSISGNTVHSNSGPVYGGGVQNGGTFTMSGNASVVGNTASSGSSAAYGGGVNTGHGTFTMTDNAVVERNTAKSDTGPAYGGGVNFGHGSIIMSGNAQIRYNTVFTRTSAVYGGGIYQHGGIVTMTDNAALIGNIARSETGWTAVGGGIHSGYTSRLNLSGSASIRNNEANSGGGVWMSYSNSIMTMSDNATIEGNTARGSGGGVHLSFSSTLQMNGGSISNNTAQNGGGVSAAQSSFVNIESGFVVGNIAHQSGGGIMATLANLTVGQNAVFAENRAATGYPYRNPVSDAIYEQNIHGTHWTNPFEQGYNNFDIAYQNAVAVTFDGNGGNPWRDSRRIAFGTSFGDDMPPYPVRDGYTFSHWNTQRDGWGYVFDSTTVVTENMTVYAQWVSYAAPVFWVIYDGNGHDGGNVPVDHNAYSFGEAVLVMGSHDLYRIGYEFIGWNTQPDGNGTFFDVGAVFTIIYDTILFAIWEEIPPVEPTIVTVIFDGNGGIVLPENQNRHVYVGGSLGDEMPTDTPAREGYIFLDWNTAQDGTGDVFTDATVINDGMTVYAVWEAIQEPDPTTITVTFNGNGGTVLTVNQTRQVVVGDSLGSDMPTTEPVREGYTFNGWNTAQDGTGNSFTNATVVNDDIIVFAQWEQIPTPPPVEPQGRVNITNIADGSRERLPNGVFGIYNAMSGERVMEVQANNIGEAFAMLDAGDYFLRQTVAPSGFQLNLDRHNFRIRANEITEVIVINRPIPTDTPPPTAQPGSLLVTAISENSGERLAGVRFNVYHAQTNVVVATLITDRFGEAFLELPIGDYFLRQTAVPSGYILNMDRVGFRIQENRLTEVTVRLRQIPTTPEPEVTPPPTPSPQPTPPTTPPAQTPTPTTPPSQTPAPAPSPTPTTPPAGSNNNATTSTPRPTTGGTLQIIARAEQSGNLLSGAAFAVYRVSDGVRITELTTGADGRVTHALASGEYYLRQLRATFGYLPETARIFFTVENNQTVVVEVTNQRDKNIPYAEDGSITLPQTGELPPVMNYVMGGALLLVAMLYGIGLFKQRKPKPNNRKGAKAYA